MCVASVSKRNVRKPSTESSPSAQNYFRQFRSVIPMLLHWSNIWIICLNVILQTWDMFLHIFFVIKGATFFSSTVFVISMLVSSLIKKQSSEGVLYELFLVNPSKSISERTHFDHSCKLATILKICCVTIVFLETWSKFTEQLF